MGRFDKRGGTLHERWLLCAAIASVALLGLVSGAGALQGETWAGDIDTNEAVGFTGELTTSASQSVDEGLLAFCNDDGQLDLSAERITVSMEISQGERVQSPLGADTWHQRSHETRQWTFQNATVFVEAPGEQATLLVEPAASLDASAAAQQDARLSSVENHTLVWSGHREGTEQGSAEFPSYEYHLASPHAILEGADRAHASGQFVLFVNDAILAIEEDGEQAWQNWTGMHQEQVAPGVQEYELRITQLTIEQGNLSINAHNSISLFGAQLYLDSRGQLEARRVDGLLHSPEQSYTLEDGSLVLDGQARTHAFPEETGSPDPSEHGFLSLEFQGEFETVRTTREQPIASFTPSEEDDEGFGALWMVPAIVLSLGTAASIARRQPALLRPLPEHWTRRWYERWKDKGLSHETAHEHERARTYYRRLVRLDPERPMGWFLLVRAHLAEEDPQALVDTVEKARGYLASVPADLWEFWVIGKAEMGDTREVLVGLERIAGEDTGLARTLVTQFELEEVVEAEQVEWWEGSSGGGPLDGYA